MRTFHYSKNMQFFIFSDGPRGCAFSPRFPRLGRLAANSHPEANIYVFITGRGNGGLLGEAAEIGLFCERSSTNKVCMNRYGINGTERPHKNVVYYTAEVPKYHRL